MSVEISKDKVIEALKVLGSTPNEIAEAIDERDIKGEVNNPRNCVLFHYLDEEFPEVKSDIAIGIPCRDGSRQIQVNGCVLDEPEVPAHVWDFIDKFDDHHFRYLELEEEEEEELEYDEEYYDENPDEDLDDEDDEEDEDGEDADLDEEDEEDEEDENEEAE